MKASSAAGFVLGLSRFNTHTTAGTDKNIVDMPCNLIDSQLTRGPLWHVFYSFRTKKQHPHSLANGLVRSGWVCHVAGRGLFEGLVP